MARTTTLGRFLDRVGLRAVNPNTWSVIKVERMLHELGIDNYDFVYQPKVVRLSDRNDLMRILLHTVPSEVSSDYKLILGKFDDDLKLKVGSWQFEAKV